MQLKLGDISTIKIQNHAWCFAAKNIGGVIYGDKF